MRGNQIKADCLSMQQPLVQLLSRQRRLGSPGKAFPGQGGLYMAKVKVHADLHAHLDTYLASRLAVFRVWHLRLLRIDSRVKKDRSSHFFLNTVTCTDNAATHRIRISKMTAVDLLDTSEEIPITLTAV